MKNIHFYFKVIYFFISLQINIYLTEKGERYLIISDLFRLRFL